MDVTVETEMGASPERVAAVMFDPHRDPEWIGGARSATVLTPGDYGVGTRVQRQGAFLGRRFSWTTEVTEFEPDRLVRMTHIAGPFKGGVDYAIAPAAGGSRVTIRNYGEATFAFPFMGTMMRASVSRDLQRLKRLVERTD